MFKEALAGVQVEESVRLMRANIAPVRRSVDRRPKKASSGMARRTVVVRLNQQQLELLDRTSQRGKAADRVSLIRKALREQAGKQRRRGHPIIDRNVLLEMALEPGTGKALEVKAGQIFRIDQIEGLQCVDFNCFNLHDYKEFMRCGRTRTVHGFNPTTGAFFGLRRRASERSRTFSRTQSGATTCCFHAAARMSTRAQPLHVDRDQPRWARDHHPPGQEARRPCRSFGAGRRSRSAKRLWRRRHAHEQFCAKADQAHSIRGDRLGSGDGAEDANPEKPADAEGFS
jgi:Arc/MetJ-type ribon-helix-helix transcriptional regulator